MELEHNCLGHLLRTSGVEIQHASWERGALLHVHHHSSNIFKCNEPLKAVFTRGLIAEALRTKTFMFGYKKGTVYAVM